MKDEQMLPAELDWKMSCIKVLVKSLSELIEKGNAKRHIDLCIFLYWKPSWRESGQNWDFTRKILT